ncbi:SdpI family protein [Fluviispira sanaruensis]|uniref:SdpI family protein n=1 Tax=Fluviispira sanaruensis TaxID=2493639 RepID=UPI00102E4198
MENKLFLDNILFFISYLLLIAIFYTIQFLLKNPKHQFKRNRFFGHRTDVSLKSDKNWKILNLYNCKYTLIFLHIFNFINLAFMLVKYFLNKLSINKEILFYFSFVTLILLLITGLFIVFITMLNLEKRLKI